MLSVDIHRLARMGDIVGIRLAAADGVNVDEKDDLGTTPLLYAISSKQIEAVQELLTLGADPALQDRNGSTAFHYAIEHRLPLVLEALLKRCDEGIHVSDKHGNQPLWTAVFNARGDYQMVAMLLEHGADPTHRNRVSLTPSDIPKRRGEPALLELLERKSVRRSE